MITIPYAIAMRILSKCVSQNSLEYFAAAIYACVAADMALIAFMLDRVLK
jgi:hypothetical protein